MAAPKFNKSRSISPVPATQMVEIVSGKPKTAGPWSGVQFTASEGHPWHVNPRPQGDIGGEFTSVKLSIDRYSTYNLQGAFGSSLRGVVWPFENPGYRFGGYAPNSGAPSGIRLQAYPDFCSSDAFLMAQGTVAVDRCSPVNSIASVATALGELKRDGLPSIPLIDTWRTRSLTAKQAGNEYLNYQFGWAPLISDVKNFAKAVNQSSKILQQLERDSGRQVRRRYEFPIERETAELSNQGSVSPSPAYMWGGTNGTPIGTTVTTRTLERKRWFSGAFCYYLPSGDSVVSRLARGYLEAEKLLGVGLDPETLWNLTPWSWATDWVFNTGSVIANLSDLAQFGLVMPYGYIMEQTSVRYDYHIVGIRSRTGETIAAPATVTHTVKKRRRASPFGFGLTWDGFSSTQLAILAALGITRNPHH